MSTSILEELPLFEALALYSSLNPDSIHTHSLMQRSNASSVAWKAEAFDSPAADLLSSVSVPLIKQETSAPPKKKRVRRQKLELEYLRDLVGKLEQQMATLQDSRHSSLALKEEKVTTSSVNPQSIWKGIAERQQKELARAEDKNQKLRASLEGQLKLATKLERLLRKRPRDDEVSELTDLKRCKPLTVRPSDDEIFADQLQHVQQAHLEAEKVFGGPEFADKAATFCDLHVMNDPSSDSGVAFVTKASSMLPFDVHVTEKAFWRAFALEGPKKRSYFYDERLTTEDLVTRSYGLNFKAGPFSSNVRGMHTYRKYVVDDCVIIAWKSNAQPLEINGIKLNGLWCSQTGWIVLRGVNLTNESKDPLSGCVDTSSVMMSTALQSYCKITVELQDDIVDQEFQVGALTDFVVNSHGAITELCGKQINELLVEEDWNINGWLNNLVL